MSLLGARQPVARRLPSILVIVYVARLAARLVWIWAELWPIPVWAALTGWTIGARGWAAFTGGWVALFAAAGLFFLTRSHLRGDFVKDVGDTYAAILACDWRICRLTIPIWPKLINVEVQNPYSLRKAWQHRKKDGAWGLPAAACRLEFRPHSTDPVGDAWCEALEHWATNRYGFSHHLHLAPSRRSRNVLVLDMGDPIIPDAVVAGQWHD